MIAISEAFKRFLRKTFDIRNGEVARASLMQLNIFLIISTLLIVKPTVHEDVLLDLSSYHFTQ